MFLLGDTLRDPWLFFESGLAAQEVIESRGSYCFYNMASSNRWNKASSAAAQAPSSRPEFPDSQYDDEERHRSPPEGYATRKREEIPREDKRKPRTFEYRFETAWFQAQPASQEPRANQPASVAANQPAGRRAKNQASQAVWQPASRPDGRQAKNQAGE